MHPRVVSSPSAGPQLILAALLALTLSACGGDDSTGPPSAASLDGVWSGTTSQGRTLSFTVSGGVVTSLTVGFRVSGSRCTVDGSVTVNGAEAIQDGRVESSITFTDPAIDITARFTSSDRAEGTLRFNAFECAGTESATWTASKSGSGSGSESAGLTGTWQGSYSTSLVPSASATATLIQTGTSVSGTFVGSNGFTASVSGSVNGSDVTFTLTNTVSGCPGSHSGSATVSGNVLTATFSGSDCLGTHTNGTATLTRQ